MIYSTEIAKTHYTVEMDFRNAQAPESSAKTFPEVIDETIAYARRIK